MGSWSTGGLGGRAGSRCAGHQHSISPPRQRTETGKGPPPRTSPASERLRAQSPCSDGGLLATGACFLICNWGLPIAASELRAMTRQVPTAACSEHPAQKVNAWTVYIVHRKEQCKLHCFLGKNEATQLQARPGLTAGGAPSRGPVPLPCTFCPRAECIVPSQGWTLSRHVVLVVSWPLKTEQIMACVFWIHSKESRKTFEKKISVKQGLMLFKGVHFRSL